MPKIGKLVQEFNLKKYTVRMIDHGDHWRIGIFPLGSQWVDDVIESVKLNKYEYKQVRNFWYLYYTTLKALKKVQQSVSPRLMKGCGGNIICRGHGDYVACGQMDYGGIYYCSDCYKVRMLEIMTAVEFCLVADDQHTSTILQHDVRIELMKITRPDKLN